MITAEQVQWDDPWRPGARLYRLSQTVTVADDDWWYSDVPPFTHVVVSATVALFTGPETYVFAADSDGEAKSWAELPGSFRGALDHDAALAGFLDHVNQQGDTQ